MGFSEKIENMAYEKERERGEKNIERLFNLLYKCDMNDLDELLSQIKDLSKSQLYVKIIKTTTIDRRAPGTIKGTFEEGSHVLLLRAAKGVLGFGGLWTNILSNSIISLRDLALLHAYLETLYCIKKGRLNKRSDYLNIYFSGLDEKIVFALDHFDEVSLEDIPEATPEYFKQIKKVRWKDQNAKQIYDTLKELMEEITSLVLNYPDLIGYINKISEYRAGEELFIQLLAGCSAVNKNRTTIEVEDVVIAYKTFFKLIKTDVTKYKAIPERLYGIEDYNNSSKELGYLICQKCGGYYQLGPGETPNDFEDFCNCGGRLEYRTTLDD